MPKASSLRAQDQPGLHRLALKTRFGFCIACFRRFELGERAARHSEAAQANLAENLGVSRQTINAIETERYDPGLPLAFKVARLFHQAIEDVFNPE